MIGITRRELLLYMMLCCMVGVRYYVKSWKHQALERCATLEERLCVSTQEYRNLTEEYDKLIQPSRLKRSLREIARHRSE
jgi:hypothetical protein